MRNLNRPRLSLWAAQCYVAIAAGECHVLMKVSRKTVDCENALRFFNGLSQSLHYDYSRDMTRYDMYHYRKVDSVEANYSVFLFANVDLLHSVSGFQLGK